MGCLYNEFGQYTYDGKKLNGKLNELLKPIINEYYEKGVPSAELKVIVGDTISFMLSNLDLKKKAQLLNTLNF